VWVLPQSWLAAVAIMLLQSQQWQGCCHGHSSSDGSATVMVTVMVLPWPLPHCEGADVGMVVVRAVVPWQQQQSKGYM
jgi:hypothetical protein